MFVVAALALPSVAAAQDPDRRLNFTEPDFTVSTLPTTLRLPAGAFNFRLTHRFARPIAEGSWTDFVADLFGMDGAARVGLELRYGVRPGTQIAVHRTNDRSIQFSAQHQVLRREGNRPIALHAVAAVEGANNFSEAFGGSVGAVVSRTWPNRAAIYLQPIVVWNVRPASQGGSGEHALVVGLGARARLGQSRTYIVVEAAPQAAGDTAGVDHVSVGIERRSTGHVFQFVISNALGTTLRQVARGGARSGDWYVGFSLSRKFF